MVGGWADWELTALGKTHAKNIGRNLYNELKNEEWKIYSSDLARARQTAEPLARYMGLEINFVKELREMNHSGTEAADKSIKWHKENAAPTPTHDDRAFPSAESWREFWERVSGCCDRIASDGANNMIIVSHGMTMSVWQFAWLGLGICDFVYVGHPGGVCFMQVNDKGQRLINRWNDTFYMNTGEGQNEYADIKK
jgi:probable phosphoglycerate mutase